jgi:hypothetical protein
MNNSRNFFSNFSDLTGTNFSSQSMTGMQIASTARSTFDSLSNAQLVLAGVVFFGLLGAAAWYLEKSWVRVHSFMNTGRSADAVTEYGVADVSLENGAATKLLVKK